MRKPVFILRQSESTLSAIIIPTLDRPATSDRSRLQAWSQWFIQPAVLIRVVLYATTLIYLRTALFDYVYDDSLLITLHPWMESWKQFPQFLTHSFWGFMEVPRTMDYYRPPVSLVLAMIRHLLGPAPAWFHLAAAGLHILATYLVYRLAFETIGDKRVAAIAAGFFGLHPTRVETAAWISGISDSLSAVLFLASMILYFKARNDTTGRKLKYHAISTLLLLLALFSKEAAIFAPILIAIYEFSSANARFRDRCLASLRAALPFLAVTALAISARSLLVHNQLGQGMRQVPLKTTIFSAPTTIVWYLGKQLWPSELSVQYPIKLVFTLSLVKFVLPLILVLVSTVGVAWAVRRRPIGIFFASWFVLMLAPVILYVVVLQEHDRYIYLSSVALCIGIAYLVDHLRILGAHTQGAALLLLFALMAGLTLKYESYWDNDMALSTRAVQIAPANPKALEYHADTCVFLGQYAKAEAFARSVIGPNQDPEGWYILGNVLSSEQKYTEAREAYQTASKLWGGHNLMATLGLAGVDLNVGKGDEAVEIYREQLRRTPNRAFLHGRLASALKAVGKSEEAEKELAIQKSLQKTPS